MSVNINQFGSFQNWQYANMQGAPEPEIGMGCTEISWTDRTPYTVIEITSKNRVVVQEDHAKRTDDNGMSEVQSYEFSPNPDGRRVDLIRTRKGWKVVGASTYFLMGKRMKYHDYSF